VLAANPPREGTGDLVAGSRLRLPAIAFLRGRGAGWLARPGAPVGAGQRAGPSELALR